MEQFWKIVKQDKERVKRLTFMAAQNDPKYSELIKQLENKDNITTEELNDPHDNMFSVAYATNKIVRKYEDFSRNGSGDVTMKTFERIVFTTCKEEITFNYTVEANFYACGSVNVGDREILDHRFTHNIKRRLTRKDFYEIRNALKETLSDEDLSFDTVLTDKQLQWIQEEVEQQICYLMDEEEFDLLEAED